jgi:hypothetical protein
MGLCCIYNERNKKGMIKMKNKKAKTIGEMTGSRGTWNVNPISKVIQSEKNYNRKKMKKVEGQ